MRGRLIVRTGIPWGATRCTSARVYSELAAKPSITGTRRDRCSRRLPYVQKEMIHNYLLFAGLIPNHSNSTAMATSDKCTDQEKVVGDIEHLDNLDIKKGDDAEWASVCEGAADAEEAERSMTFVQAIRAYPQAAFWSFAISMCISESCLDG